MVIPNVQIHFHAAKQELIYASINRMSNAADKVSLAIFIFLFRGKSARNRRAQQRLFRFEVARCQGMRTIFQQANSQMGLLKKSTN